MDLFQYPKSKHVRALSPRKFRRYQSYKRYLQSEFSRVCVYCRQPDSSAPNLGFGVDHYRPKGLPQFAHLLTSYNNLFYCCRDCNSRKNNDWPLDEKLGPYVVNPCDAVMTSHLRFDAKTGRVEVSANSKDGKHTEELLQLNDDAAVKYRAGAVLLVKTLEAEKLRLGRQLKALAKRVKVGTMPQADYDSEKISIESDVASLESLIQAQTGKTPLPLLPRRRNGINLIP